MYLLTLYLEYGAMHLHDCLPLNLEVALSVV